MAFVESSKFVDNPKLCVSRQISACSICRGKKIKCDGLVPVCSPCQRSHRESECTNGSDKFAKGKERSYVTALENRLDKLEKEIARARRQGGADAVSKPLATAKVRAALTTKGQRKEESHVNELVSDFGFLSVNATSRDFDGLAQDVFAQLILAPSMVVKLPTTNVDILPSRYTVISLVQHYIDHDLSFYPFLPEAKIFGSIEALYEGRAAPSDEWTVFLILAIALSSLSGSQEDGRYAEAVRYAGAVLEHAKLVLLPGSLQAIQMMLLLVQYSMRNPHHFDSWYLAGAAARMTVDLGLHQDPPKSVKMKDSQLDLRRRIFYSVYSLDRATSMLHHRAFSFSDESTNVALPKVSNATIAEHGTGIANPAIELIRLRQVASSAYFSLFQSGPDVFNDPWPTICVAHQALDEWERNLRQTNIQEAQKSLFRSEMLYIKIVLLSPPRLGRPLEDYGQLLIFEHANQFAQITSSLVDDRVDAAICTSYDLRRSIFVIERLTEVLIKYENVCFGDLMPALPQTSASTNLPRPSASNSQERLVSSVTGLSMLEEVIRTLGRRYGVPKSWLDLKPRFNEAYATLSTRLHGTRA